jgi:uncharacterized membrane protein YhaH (DUF805 family)
MLAGALIIGLVTIGTMSAVVMYFERSAILMKRMTFFIMILLFAVIAGFCVVLSEIGELNPQDDIYDQVCILMFLIYIFFLSRAYVRRSRDAGLSKSVAYLSIIPGVNIVTTLILLIAKSDNTPRIIEEDQNLT